MKLKGVPREARGHGEAARVADVHSKALGGDAPATTFAPPVVLPGSPRYAVLRVFNSP